MLRAEYRENGVSKENNILIEKIMRVSYLENCIQDKSESEKSLPLLAIRGVYTSSIWSYEKQDQTAYLFVTS